MPDSETWSWRLSLADVVADGPFSSLPGIDRWIAVARGTGMELRVESLDGRDDVSVLDESSDPVLFSGDRPARCRVLDGPLVDLNLMIRRGWADGVLDVVRLGPGDVRQLVNPTAVVVLSGAAEIGVNTLAPFDAALPEEELFDAGDRTPWIVHAIEPSRVAIVTVTTISPQPESHTPTRVTHVRTECQPPPRGGRWHSDP